MYFRSIFHIIFDFFYTWLLLELFSFEEVRKSFIILRWDHHIIVFIGRVNLLHEILTWSIWTLRRIRKKLISISACLSLILLWESSHPEVACAFVGAESTWILPPWILWTPLFGEEASHLLRSLFIWLYIRYFKKRHGRFYPLDLITSLSVFILGLCTAATSHYLVFN